MKTISRALALAAVLLVAACQHPPQPEPPVRNPHGGTDDCGLFFDNSNLLGVANGAVAPRFVQLQLDTDLLGGWVLVRETGAADADTLSERLDAAVAEAAAVIDRFMGDVDAS